MRCKKCKAKLSKKDKRYCPHCGAPIPKRRRWPVVLGIVIALLLAGGGITAWWFLGGPGSSGQEEGADAVEGADAAQDADDSSAVSEAESEYEEALEELRAAAEYDYDETVYDRITASTSTDNLSVADLADALDERGFIDYSIYVNYSLDGGYLGNVLVDASSTDTYPLYTVYWPISDDSSEFWAIYVVNGAYMAGAFFDDYDYTAVQTVLIEGEYVTSYDASEDEFIVSTPGASELATKQVDQITAELLGSLGSYEEVDDL